MWPIVAGQAHCTQVNFSCSIVLLLAYLNRNCKCGTSCGLIYRRADSPSQCPSARKNPVSFGWSPNNVCKCHAHRPQLASDCHLSVDCTRPTTCPSGRDLWEVWIISIQPLQEAVVIHCLRQTSNHIKNCSFQGRSSSGSIGSIHVHTFTVVFQPTNQSLGSPCHKKLQ